MRSYRKEPTSSDLRSDVERNSSISYMANRPNPYIIILDTDKKMKRSKEEGGRRISFPSLL